ncbi:MAG: YdcF family protein [Clostridia bacterium]|nr:YdcF family protein [Clostridia bacterium]
MKVIRIICILLGAFLVLDTILVSFLSNYNLGVILPAVIGLPLLLLGAFMHHMNTGFGAFLKWFLLCCYALGAVFLLVMGILMGTASKRADKVDADALIVLGAAVHGDRVTWVLSNRLDTAADWLESHPDALCVVSGGQGSGETVSEASAMQKYLVGQKGVEPSRILVEDRAESTKENFAFSKALIEQTLGKDAKIAFVTTDFHVFRARRVALKTGIDAEGIAAPDVWYIRINNFLRECVGITVYALRGNI